MAHKFKYNKKARAAALRMMPYWASNNYMYGLTTIEVQVLRAVRIIDLEEGRGTNVTSLAYFCNLPRETVSRAVRTLCDGDWLDCGKNRVVTPGGLHNEYHSTLGDALCDLIVATADTIKENTTYNSIPQNGDQTHLQPEKN